MRFNRRLLGYAILVGGLTWVLDAAMDFFFFYDEPFFSLLLFAIPAHEVFVRLLLLAVVLTFGLIASWSYGTLESRNREVTLFRELIDGATDSIFVLDPETGEILDANATACSTIGCEKEDLQSKRFADLTREGPTGVPSEGETPAPDGQGFTEMVLEDGTGTGIPVEVSAKKVTSENQAYEVAIARDVSERKERERRLETLIGNLPGLVYRCKNEEGWPMETVRGRCEELTGYSPSALTSGSVSWGEDLIHPEDRSAVWADIQTAIEAGDSFELTYRILTEDGTEKWVWERGEAIEGPDSLRLEGFITDVTQPKRLQERLKTAKERYESLFKSIRDAIVVVDLDRRITNCNPAFEELFGYQLAEIEGQKATLLHENTDSAAAMGEAMEWDNGEDGFRRSVTFQKRSGQPFPAEVDVFTLRDAENEEQGYIGVIRDVSERQRRIGQLQAIDRVLQHNFNNEINVVLGNADLIDSKADAAIRPQLERIETAGRDLLDTVRKEREITKFLADPPPEEPIDVLEMVESGIDRVQTKYPDATIHCECPPGATARATVALGQAIEELLTNSVQYAESGDRVVTITVTVEPGTVVIAVADSNPPIPAMERNVLLGEAELEPLYHGSGLGLWLVKHIVGHSDGVIEFAENEPRGNVVRLRLPRVRDGG